MTQTQLNPLQKKKFVTQPNPPSPKNRPNPMGWVGSSRVGGFSAHPYNKQPSKASTQRPSEQQTQPHELSITAIITTTHPSQSTHRKIDSGFSGQGGIEKLRGRERGSVVNGRDSEKQRERHRRFLRLHLGVHKGMKWNRME